MKFDRKGMTGTLDEFIRLIMIIITVTALSATIYARYFSKNENTSLSRESKVLDSLDRQIRKFKIQSEQIKEDRLISEKIQKLILETPKMDTILTKYKLLQLNSDLNKYMKITEGLRQAFNPSKPEEVLTIARLKDEVDELKQSQKDLADKLKDQQLIFQDSIKREVLATSNSNYWIMFILVPLVLQFAYNIWKDNKKPKETT